MGNDRIRYLVFSKGRWRWQPTNAMREHGFKTIKLSKGGPAFDRNGYPAASIVDKNRAVALNADWDAARLGLPVQKAAGASAKYPPGKCGGRISARYGPPPGGAGYRRQALDR
jgi:hypothetical protein